MSNGNRPPGDRSIYVVDDDDAIRALLVNYLEDEGFRVLEGRSGGEVLPTVQKESPDSLSRSFNRSASADVPF